MATLWIDGKEYPADLDKNLLEAILAHGLDLPYFCWHPALGSVGSCRQCAVRKYRDADDKQGQIVMSCMEPVMDNLHISIDEQEVKEFRKSVIEWLMVNHPHDCPICDEGGECHLQDMTVMAGHAYRRYRYKKRTHLNQDLGPCINHEMNRCIQCYRCVRFYNDYAGANDLQVFAAHDHVYFGRQQDGTLESEFSGNLVEVCPTGVFTDKTLKDHYTRKWDLTSAPSVCHHCSLGCNILAGERYGSLRRVLSRFNQDVNGYFICDRGRFGYEFVNGEQRIREASIHTAEGVTALSTEEALQKLADLIGQGRIMGLGSPRASLESNFALRKVCGPEHFYQGISGTENQLTQSALDFLRHSGIRTPSLKEIETYDAVVVIGEDVTNTAPMIDLALRQSVRVQPLKKIKSTGIPAWNDAAVRDHLQQEMGPLFMLTPQETKLDSIATLCIRQRPSQLARTVRSIASHLGTDDPEAEKITDESAGETATIAKALRQAERPLVVCGTSLSSQGLLQVALQLTSVLYQVNQQAGITLVFPECNSLGMAMMENKSLDDAMKEAGDYQTLLILENDLVRRKSATDVKAFLDKFKNVVVLDHTVNPTVERASLVLASGTYAEADGTLVNNEGRAQRFFQVQASDEQVMESWRWLMRASQISGSKAMEGWLGLDDIIRSLESDLVSFVGISKAAPGADLRVNGQRFTRSPQRYSGRTAMFAQHRVNEPRPPADPDSPLSFTMEGYSGIPPASATAFYWSPGWNSAQAINKFRNEIQKPGKQADTGVRLIEPQGTGKMSVSGKLADPGTGEWEVVPVHQIFGSEELSMRCDSLVARSPGPFILINQEDAIKLKVDQDQTVTLSTGEFEIRLPVRITAHWPPGAVGVPAGFPGLPPIDPVKVETIKITAAK